MNKPTVFLSHSSHDEALVRRLSEALRKKTAGVIDIFVSSDGQSIPLGRNWVSRIEEALESCTLMFVLLSPQSIDAKWLYFEAGYAHSRKIRVVPVGVIGIDLGKLTPPLSLLQGFNLDSADKLNNLIELINREYGYDHELSFTEVDYAVIFLPAQEQKTYLQEISSWVETLQVRSSITFNDAARLLGDIYRARKIGYQGNDWRIESYGVSYRQQSSPHPNENEEPGSRPLSANIDPLRASLHLGILQEALGSNDGMEAPVRIAVHFSPWVHVIAPEHRLTARIPGSGIKFGEHYEFRFGRLSFWIHSGYDFDDSLSSSSAHVRLDVEMPIGIMTGPNLLALIRVLFNREILYIGDEVVG